METLLRADEPGPAFWTWTKRRSGWARGAWCARSGAAAWARSTRAERDDGQFEQRAAIKVIKRGMDTDAVLRASYAERQILARLQHPNITRLLDGGMFDHRPYFVMEYLEGEPPTRYAGGRTGSLERRIALPHGLHAWATRTAT